MSNYLALRSSATPALTVSTLLAKSITFQSTMISLGQSTNQSYNNFTSGLYTNTLWGSTLGTSNVLSTVNDVIMSQSGQYQYALQGSQSSIATNQVSRSIDSGINWQTLNNTGLPVTTYAYQSTMTGFPSYTNMTMSATGQYALTSVRGGQLYVSNNANSDTPVFTPANVGGYPYIYMPLENSVADRMGNSVVTATGSPAFNVTGKVGTNAMNLVNTAGGTAAQYVRGTWTGTPSGNLTVSGWFNAQTVNGTQQMIYSAYQAAFTLLINTSNQLVAYTPSGGAASAIIIGTTSFTITANTWYSFTTIYQAGGVCSFYVNNSLIGTTTNVGGTGTLTSTQFSIGTYDTSLANAFNGYIDDFEIYHFAAPNVVNPRIYLPMEGATTDVMGFSTVTPTGSPGYVPGVVGSQALNLTNTLGPTTSAPATQYIRASWSGSSRWSVSFWFNMQSYSTGQSQSTLFSSFEDTILIMIYNNSLGLYTNSGTQIATTTQPSMNTWHYVTYIHQNNGLCSLYLNNSLVGTYNNPSALGTATRFSLGTYNAVALYPFNGYIDDFRIYNYAIAYSPINPMNWSQTAVSPTGQYMLAAASNGGVFQSSNFGASWSQLTTSQITSLVSPGQAAMTNNGPTITPNLTGLAAFTWTKGGVNWRASASTTLTGGIYEAYSMFDNNYSNRWVALSQTYTTAGNSSGISNTIIGVGTVTGDWLQIQSSVPLVMSSYQFATGYFTTRSPKTYYITGSNDGSNWYPLQYVSGGTITTTASATLVPGVILINSTSTQTFGSSTVATTAYSTSTNAYTSFRLVSLTSYSGSADFLDIGEWLINFTLPMPLYVAPSSTIVAPQLTGLASSGTALTASWTTSGVNWLASASSVFSASYPVSYAFNNTASSFWTGSGAYTTTGNTASSTTFILGGIGSIQGDWLQIQSSIPLIMPSYQFAMGGAVNYMPKNYYIVGSNDGTTWYPIQYGAGGTLTTTPANTLVPGIITVYSTGVPLSQTFGSSTITTTAYSTAANAYTYFRLIGVSAYNTGVIEIGEWYITFTAPAPSNTSLLTVTPQQTGLAANTWTTTNGVSWMASASTNLSGNFFSYNVFNNNITVNNTWAPSSVTYGTAGNSSGITTVIQGVVTATGDWTQIQSSVPLVMASYQFATGGSVNQLPKTYYIVGSNDGTTWYPIQFGSGTGAGTSSVNTVVPGTIIVNSASTQTFGSSTITTTTYSTTTNAYTYFRLIGMTIYTASGGVLEIAEWLINFTAATPNPVNALAISNTNMMVSAAGATAPNLAGLAANTWTVNGVNWTASASSVNGGWSIFRGFNNTTGEGWLSDNVLQRYTNGVVNANAATTTIQTIGSTAGEWLQIQSSVPVVMNSYAFGIGPNAYPASNTPKTYYIVGSNDGTTWYPIHYGNFTVSAFTSSSSYININITGTQTLVGTMVGSVATTAYSYSTNAYTYFRLIGTSLLYTAGGGSYMEVGEWFINFQSGATYISTNNGLTWSTALTAPSNAPLLATAGSYVLTGANQTVYVYSNGITGAYTTPTLTGINANILSAAMSVTGQYMVIVTLGTTNNVFYSINYGVTWTALTIGNSAMTSCAMSADGSYLTVSNATAVFTLNRNTQGFSITVGNQAGLINQGLNTVAIGNQAGLMNQSANSIILNASTAAVNAYSQGFYVAPIASSGSSSMSSFSVLGYGADNQIVQSSSFFIGANGNVGIGTANPTTALHVNGNITSSGSINGIGNVNSVGALTLYDAPTPVNGFIRLTTAFGVNYIQSGLTATSDSKADIVFGSIYAASEWMRIKSNGNVGIGTANPGYALHVVGGIYATGDIAALSDQRYKQNIVRLDRSLENLLQLSGYSYTREDYRPGEKQIGLLAQEVSTVFPEAVQYDEANDKYGVNYNCLIAPLVESIKSLHEQIKAQRHIITQLVDRLGPL